MVVGETGANGHRTTTPGAEHVSLACRGQSGPFKHGSRSRPSLSDASGREVARCSAVAYEAILRLAGRRSAFRTRLANVTGPPWFGLKDSAARVFSRPAEPARYRYGTSRAGAGPAICNWLEIEVMRRRAGDADCQHGSVASCQCVCL